MATHEVDLEAKLEIEICGLSKGGVNLKLRLLREPRVGFREDAMVAIFGGVTLKEHEYNNLTVGTRVLYQGIKAAVKIVTDEDVEIPNFTEEKEKK